MAAAGEDDSRMDAGNAAADALPSPFNFQTQIISASPPKPKVGQRRGHRYKHSSVSTQHQIFQEPPSRPPPVLPASLPIPTLAEAWASMHKDQRTRLYWCLCHVAVAVLLFFRSQGSLAVTALSHLVFFDAGSAAVCVAVDVLGNFEVWRRSSIRHPFGLERAEVLAGFAMSVFLLFGGFDLVSHSLKHVLESMGDHVAHHEHRHHPNYPHHEHQHDDQVSSSSSSSSSSSYGATAASAAAAAANNIDWSSVAAVVSTLVSAYGLKNHRRIAKLTRVSYLSSLPSILSNPFHALTLSFSFLLLFLPLLPAAYLGWLDKAICAAIALAMFALGIRLAVAQALMLLMSYGGASGSREVGLLVREIALEPAVARVETAQFWQVHYGLGLANLRVAVARATSSDDMSLAKLRNRISALVQTRLGEGYGHGGSLRWEVTLQLNEQQQQLR